MTGRAFSSLMVLVNIYPAIFGMSNPDIYKAQWQLAILADTIAEADIRKNFKNVKEPEDALTLSRYLKDGRVHTVAVLEDDGERITGIDLSVQLSRYDRNSFDVIKGLEFSTVVRHIRSGSDKVSIQYDELLPCVEGKEHIAIGINYAEHGKETGQVKPFMFPKFVQTDPAIHKIKYQNEWLLDYEVELGIVFPSAVCSSADLDHMMIGFLVVNDFTDRAELMRKMDSQNVKGGKGFADAKSKAGFLPTGPYMVIPKDWRDFVTELQLQLSVNGEIRQKGSAKVMVWNINEIIRRTLLEKGKYDSYFQDKKDKLFEGDCIPPNSIIITGTPSGVVFNAPTGSFIFSRVLKYMFTGKFFSKKMHPYVVEQYLKKDMKNPHYLKPGDHVESSINYLGTIATCIGK